MALLLSPSHVSPWMSVQWALGYLLLSATPLNRASHCAAQCFRGEVKFSPRKGKVRQGASVYRENSTCDFHTSNHLLCLKPKRHCCSYVSWNHQRWPKRCANCIVSSDHKLLLWSSHLPRAGELTYMHGYHTVNRLSSTTRKDVHLSAQRNKALPCERTDRGGTKRKLSAKSERWMGHKQ